MRLCDSQASCGVRWIGQVAKLLDARADVRLTRAFGSGRARRGRCGRERGVEVTVREQQRRRMKHENGEGETEIRDMHMQQTFLQTLEPCVYAMSVRHAKKMCVRQESACTPPVAHTLVATTCVRNPGFENLVPPLCIPPIIRCESQFYWVNTGQSSVLVCVFFRKVRDAIVVRIVDGRRVIVHRSVLVELFGLINCVKTGDLTK